MQENGDSESIADTDDNNSPSNTVEVIPAYKSSDGTTNDIVTFPRSTTVDSLYDQVKSLWEQHESNEDLELVWVQEKERQKVTT